jgi:hypothetical protein
MRLGLFVAACVGFTAPQPLQASAAAAVDDGGGDSGGSAVPASGGSAVSPTPTTIAAFSPGLTEYQGRVAVGKAGLPADSISWDWLGSQVSVTLTSSSYLTLKVDTSKMLGTKMARLRCFAAFGATMGTPTLYPLSEIVLLPSISEYAVGAWPRGTGGWNGSAHSTQVTVTIMNDQEWATGGVVTLLSMTSDGTFVAPILPKTMATRRMVVIGDSITAGTNLRRPIGDASYGIPMAPSTPISGIMDDYPQTYQAQLCQAFGANCSTIAYGGKGMYKNCCDEGTTMPEFFQQRLTSEPARNYSFGADGFVPDAVRKTDFFFLRHLYMWMIILPRQARDKRMEKYRKSGVLFSAGRHCAGDE